MPPRAPHRASILLGVAAVSITLLSVTVTACGVLPPLTSQATAVPGEGEVATQDRTTSAFSRISVGAGMHVTVRTGAETSVTLTAQENLLPLITTEVQGDQLVVEVTAPGISSTKPIALTIHVPDLASISLSAGASGTVEVVGSALAVDVSAGALIKAIGELDSLQLTVSSGASAQLGEVRVGSASVTLTGGSSAEIHVTGAVTGTADGGSTVLLTEKPASVDVTTSGGASVQGG